VPLDYGRGILLLLLEIEDDFSSDSFLLEELDFLI
jgi:hypothetical protein